MAIKKQNTMAATPDPVDDADGPPDKQLDQPERGPATPNAPLPERVRVDEDTLIERPDLGPGARTFVAEGDLIPAGLEDLPRGPA